MAAVLAGALDAAADINADGGVNGLDVAPFIGAVIAGGPQAVPEPQVEGSPTDDLDMKLEEFFEDTFKES